MLLKDAENFVQPVHEKLKNSNRRNPCPVCGKTGCGVNSRIVLCWRVSAGSQERVKSGAYLHLREGFHQPLSLQVQKAVEPKASPELISKVYDSLLDCLILDDRHLHELKSRGLSKEVIFKNKYRTTPTKVDGHMICKYLGGLYNLDFIPGFYQDESRRINIKGSGVFIPYRNLDGSIRGMQIRPDRGALKYLWFSSNDFHKGASSGSFVHYARPDIARSRQEIYITEGGLKADCISALGKVGVAAIAGVTAVNYETLMEEIKTGLPEVKKVILAFDADWKSNTHVKDALMRLHEVAKKYHTVEIEDWDIKLGKGYDDKLLREQNG